MKKIPMIILAFVIQAQPLAAAEIPAGLLPVLADTMENQVPPVYYARPLDSGRLIASNPAQALDFELSPAGLSLTAPHDRSWSMKLDSWGFDGCLSAVGQTRPVADGARVEMKHRGLTEWYFNSPLGLEQGFTVNRPDGATPSRLTLGLTLGGEAEVRQEGRSLVLDPSAERPIHYSGLYAFDGSGRELPSSLQLDGVNLTIEVDLTDAVFPVTVDPLFYQENRISPSDGSHGDRFGWSIDVDGDTVLVGAPYDDQGTSPNHGSVYVYVRDNVSANWYRQAKLTSPDTFGQEDLFGYSVAVSKDLALIGAIYDNENGFTAGAAFVFSRSGSNWSFQQKLMLDDGGWLDWFGYAVALQNEPGSPVEALIGVPNRDSFGGTDSGEVAVFRQNGSTWEYWSALTALDNTAGAKFGISVALDGEFAVVGSHLANGEVPGAGAAYVFKRQSFMGDDLWWWNDVLTAPDGAADDWFGFGVAVAGNYIMVGAPQDDDLGQQSGSAYIFKHTANGWGLQTTLRPSGTYTSQARFGWQVGISGRAALVSASQQANPLMRSGAFYAYTRSGGNWTEENRISPTTAHNYDDFGSAAAMDGATAVIGAPYGDDHGTESGFACIFDFPPVPDLQGNNQDGPLVLDHGEQLNVTISVDPNSHEKDRIELWLYCTAGSLGTYWRTQHDGWVKSGIPIPLFQGQVREIPSATVLDISGLPARTYNFRFAIDEGIDGIYGGSNFDNLDVTIQ